MTAGLKLHISERDGPPVTFEFIGKAAMRNARAVVDAAAGWDGTADSDALAAAIGEYTEQLGRRSGPDAPLLVSAPQTPEQVAAWARLLVSYAEETGVTIRVTSEGRPA